jgi:hypothetical protein
MGASLLRWLGWGAIIAIAGLGSWLVLARGYADYLVRVAPDRAVELNPRHAGALGRLAERALVDGDLERAETLAARSVAAGFFEGRAMRVLGAVAERSGDQSRARALMLAAATAQPRDTSTQYWLALDAIARQDPTDAMARLDRVLRFEPAVMNELFPILGTFASNPVGARALVPFLSKAPGWRDPFFTQLIRQSSDLTTVVRLGKLLTAAGSPLTETESHMLIDSLTARRDWALLREITSSDPDDGLIRDGGFTGDSAGLLRAWRIDKVKGADIRLGPETGNDQSSLRLYFYDRRVAFRHVSQLLLLEPGRYELSGRARLNRLKGPQGLVWTVRCEAPAGPSVGSTDNFLGTHAWQPWRAEFTVPADDCGAQWLVLEIPARIAAERQLDGDAAFDDLQIQPK